MSEKTHWKKLTHPDYLGAYALEKGKDLIVKIEKVVEQKVTGADGKSEMCVVAHFAEPSGTKPMILNKTNLKTIEKVLASPFIEDWASKKIQLFSTPVKAFGDTVDALRIRPISPKDQLPPLPQEKIQTAKDSIASGATTLEAVQKKYALTPDQIKELTNAS